MSTHKIVKNPRIEKKPLYCPSLQEISDVLNLGLKSNFSEVAAEIVECPDLTLPPFTLACKGLGGKPRLIEIGGVPYLAPLVKREKLYDLKSLGKQVEIDPAFIIGAGAGPWPHAGVNCEMMANMEIKGESINNQTRIAKVSLEDGSCILQTLPTDETRCALLANLFGCQGEPCKVIKVHCKKRTGKLDFIASIRTTLEAYYKEKAVGLGGTFLLKQGKAKQHIMPDFSAVPLKSDQDIENWLRFYNMSAPLIAVGTLASADPGLDLRVQHFHSFSHHGEGGHYHIDTDPETAEYLGYFALAEWIYRIDRPEETHKFGRD